MDHFKGRETSYRTLSNDLTSPLASLVETPTVGRNTNMLEHEHDDTTNVIIHKVPKTKGLTHVVLLCLYLYSAIARHKYHAFKFFDFFILSFAIPLSAVFFFLTSVRIL